MQNSHSARYETRVYEGSDPVGFVVSLNLTRRHLNESQRAMVAGRVATAKVGGDRQSYHWSNSTDAFTNDYASKLLNVGTTAVKSAKKVQSKGIPENVDYS